MRDFLGREAHRPARPGYRAFPLALRFAQDLGLTRATEWRRWCREGIPGLSPVPEGIPSSPGLIYRPLGFKGYPDWLGNPRWRRREWPPFGEVRRD